MDYIGTDKDAPRSAPTYRESMGEKVREFNPVFGIFKHDELKAAFEAVINQKDWQAPIDAWVPVKDKFLTTCAIAYYTSDEAKQFGAAIDGKVRITSRGYRDGPCGC